ncbi:MAG: hypothetical protein AAB461_02055 [Patescibacteria group bacterium]
MFKNYRHLAKITFLLLIIAMAFWTSGIVKNSDFVIELIRRFGYGGIFLISVVSGFNVAIPVPAVAFMPLFIASGLNIFAVIVIIAAGMTLADFIGFLLGKTGRRIAVSALERNVLIKFERIKKKLDWSPTLILFLFASVAPFPNEIIVVPMAFLGYKFIHILLPVFFGNMIFNSIYAIGAVNIFKLISW